MNNPHFSRRQWFGSALTACAGAALAGIAEAQDTLPAGYTKPGPIKDFSRSPGMQVRRLTSQSSGERTYAIIFAKGDEVLSGLTAFAVQGKMTGGFFTAIGAFARAKFGWFDAQKKAYRDIPVDQQVELVSLVGDVGLVDGKPQVHTHGAVGLPDGTMRGGHLLEAIAWPTVEVFFTALPVTLVKTEDAETGLSLFDLEANL